MLPDLREGGRQVAALSWPRPDTELGTTSLLRLALLGDGTSLHAPAARGRTVDHGKHRTADDRLPVHLVDAASADLSAGPSCAGRLAAPDTGTKRRAHAGVARAFAGALVTVPVPIHGTARALPASRYFPGATR